MAKECLKMYFMKPPPGNQFLCRAYLCQAQLLAPKEANDPVSHHYTLLNKQYNFIIIDIEWYIYTSFFRICYNYSVL